MTLFRTMAALALAALPVFASALDTSITLTPDTSITPTADELVTFGLPLARGDVLDVSEIRVLRGSTELNINVQAGLRWHWLDNSLRSVTIQLQGVDMTAGDVTLRVTDAGRDTAQDLQAQPPANGWANAGPLKANLPFPRIFAVHDLVYLANSGIVPPYVPGSVDEGVGKLQSDQFDANFGALDYAGSSGASWLFDRATSMLKAYMITGDVKFLKEGFLSKQFYFTYVRNDGSAPAPDGGSGCWSYGSIACADGKYIYTQPAKLAWALFGDRSQWDDALINNMALQADLGNWQHATRDTYSNELEGFTERSAGIAGLAEVSAYEITGDVTILTHLTQRIDALRDMQQTPKAWDIQYGWTPMSGAFTHSWAVHENDTPPPSGTAEDRRFSPWMSENIADFLWQAYHISNDAALSTTIAEMLRQLGNAIDLYGFMSSYAAGEGVNATYTRKPDLTGSVISCPSPDNLAIELMYSGSAYAPAAALRLTQLRDGGFVDQHNVEVILPLALAYHFETDAAAKQRLMARIEHMQRQWTSNPAKNCASVFSRQVYRLFNWQHRSNSVGTWQWVKTSAGIVDIAPARISLDYPGHVWASTGDCVDGNSWHYQCKGHWVEGSDYASQQLIATCGRSDGMSCANEGLNRRWTATALLKDTTYVRTCTSGLDSEVRGSCEEVRYLQSGGVTGKVPADAAVTATATTSADNAAVRLGTAGDEGVRRSANMLLGASGGEAEGSARAALDLVVNAAGAPTPPVGAVNQLLFWNATAAVVDMAPPLNRHFWAGLPDVNGDGCLDMFAGTHSDGAPSSMFVQQRGAAGCLGTFNYVSTEQSAYTQAKPETPRISSRYMWGNWYGHPQGLWSFFGHDVDGSTSSARYVVSADSQVGDIPQYDAKSKGCNGSKLFCLPLDVDGNGSLELVTHTRSLRAPEMGYIRDINTGGVLLRPNAGSDIYGNALAVFDVDNDRLPEIVHAQAGGYWKYNESRNALDWLPGKFTGALPHVDATDNHVVPLDYDSDGDLDLYFGAGVYSDVSGSAAGSGVPYTLKGANVFAAYLYRNEGNGTFTDVTAAAGLAGSVLKNTYFHTSYANSVAADLNLDGYPDLVFAGEGHGHGSTKSTVVLLVNNGDGTFRADRSNDFGIYVTSPTNGGKPWINTGDYDNDGLIDIVKTHGVSSPQHASIALFRNVMNRGGNTWMRVRVRGPGLNSDGLHASLVFRDPVTGQIITSYQVGAFSVGYQNLLTHAGLGQRAVVDLEVRYAHGVSYTYRNLATNRDIVVFHDGSILEDYHPGDVVPMHGSSAEVATSPLDPQAFAAGLRALAAAATSGDNGAMLVQVGNTTFSLRAGPLWRTAVPRSGVEAVFGSRGNMSNPHSYRIFAMYPDGRTQDLPPYIHEMDAFVAWLQGEELTHSFDFVSGQLYVRNRDGRLIWHGIPAYNLHAVAAQSPRLITGSDYNGDGLFDVAFQAGEWNQVLYSLGL